MAKPLWYVLTPDKKATPAPKGFAPTDEWWLNERRVDETILFLGVRISTVFLALDHNHSGEGPPILFETMIFGGKFDQTCWRYHTWEEAVEGHKKAVKYAYTQFTGEESPDGPVGTGEAETLGEWRSAASCEASVDREGSS